MPEDYSRTSVDFNDSLDTFHIGTVEKLKDILNYN